ncbi:KAP family P-loop NTPase fold protein [Arthrobacter sedimenti]|uniref:P-loop NTPase fold protein n=1 Tax=Arthrobacter sedimenti TaxID=2694931 RepID=A0ABV8WDB3_9MICC
MNVTVDGWLSDDPISGDTPESDLLGMEGFVESSFGLLKRIRSQSESSVIALIGPWGAGKTSVLNLLTSKLDGIPAGTGSDWVVINFNPWHYQDLPSLQEGFFRELDKSVPSGKSWKKVRNSISGFSRSIAPISSLASLAGIDPSKAVAGVAELIAAAPSVAETRRAAEIAMRKAGKPVLMILDDLDRLAPEELLLVFKLIRLIGRLPNIYYLVSYDEETLLDVLSRTGLVGAEDPRRAINYLEKIVQVRLDLPPLRAEQTSSWVDEAVNSFASRFSLSPSPEELNRFTRAYRGHIRHRLDTPRAIKRYFGQIDAFFGQVRDEVDWVDFLLVSWLRTAEPLVYDLMIRERDELLGTSDAVMNAHGLFGIREKTGKDHWSAKLTASRVSENHVDGVAYVLGLLFPRFQSAWHEPQTEHSPRAKAGRISNPDYFDRFVSFQVPDGDISDVLVRTAYQQIIDGVSGPQLLRVGSEFAAKTDILVDKLENLFEERKQGGVQLLEWLASHYSLLGDEYDLVTPRTRVQYASQRVYLSLPATDVVAALESAAQHEEGLALASFWIYAATGTDRFLIQDTPERQAAYADAQVRFLQLVQEDFDRHRNLSPLDFPVHVWNLIWDWIRLDEDGARIWLQAAIREEAWPLLDVAGSFVVAQSSVGSAGAKRTLRSLELETLDRMIGLNRVYESLGSDMEDVDDSPPNISDVTPNSRRQFALKMLKKEWLKSQSEGEGFL